MSHEIDMDAIKRMAASEHEGDALAVHLESVKRLLQEEDPKEAIALIEHALAFYRMRRREIRGEES